MTTSPFADLVIFSTHPLLRMNSCFCKVPSHTSGLAITVPTLSYWKSVL